MKPHDLNIETQNLKTAALHFKAVLHPLRRQMLSLIKKSNRISVGDIYRTLNMEQSIASCHLRILRNTGLVTTIRNGRIIQYSVNNEQMQNLQKAASQLDEPKPKSGKK